ncbi:unnamed protein product [Rotaria socialis]|uniref:Uncharacterized protein n=1 Tax=Rotaria socialis TaxID=392032 RepID=A0A818DK83_9BILA|nr:unnamed protein product [Rotaria socialis]
MQVPDTQADVIADKMVDNNQCSSNIKANHANHQNELMRIENQTTHPKEYSIIHIDNDASIKNVRYITRVLELFFLADNLPPAGCYDDGCYLVQYLHNHIRKDLVATDAATVLSNVKFSVGRTHFKNHVGEWCLAHMNPDDNKLLDEMNTEAAEQNFSWLKNYSSIITVLGWRRAPVFLLLLFHMKNLALCHVRPNRFFDIIMSMSNEQIFDRLKQLGCNPPTINENNRMYGLAMIYNFELELNSDIDDMVSDDQDMEQKLLCKEQQRKID